MMGWEFDFMISQQQLNEMQARLAPKTNILRPISATVCLVISGQIRGGKNNMVVTRNGLHFPKPEWAKWRDEAVSQIKRQLPPCFKPIAVQIDMRLRYIAGDNRRRDMPAILDSIFHVLEKAGVVTDDTNIWVSESSRSYDKENPMAMMFLTAVNP
jgi:Holliday junction resolvase RusA-like endonuclease